MDPLVIESTTYCGCLPKTKDEQINFIEVSINMVLYSIYFFVSGQTIGKNYYLKKVHSNYTKERIDNTVRTETFQLNYRYIDSTSVAYQLVKSLITYLACLV